MNNWNQASQQAAQAAMQRSQQQFQQQQQRWRMDNQQQQLQQLQQQVARRRARQQAGVQSPPASLPSMPYVRVRPRRRLLKAMIVIALLAAGVGIYAANQKDDPIGGSLGGSITARLPGPGDVFGGDSGVVIATPTVGLRVRSAPSSDSAILDTVRPGQELRLACQTDGGWDRLAEPYAGAYVYDQYIRRSQPLEPCS